MSAMAPVDATRVVAEAAKKSQVGWLSVDERPGVAVWFVVDGADLLIVEGPGEQRVEGIAAAQAARITLRSKDTGGSVVEADLTLTRVDKASEGWDTAAKLLSPKRLNGVSEDLTAQWRQDCELYRLSPTSASVELERDGGYEPLRQSDAGTGRPIPFHLGRRTRRKQGA